MSKKVYIKDLSFELAEELKLEKERMKVFFDRNGILSTKEISEADFLIVCTFGYFSDIEQITINYVNSVIVPNFTGTLIIYGELVGTTGKIEESIECDTVKFIGVKQEDFFDDIFSADVKYNSISSLEIAENNIVLCDAADRKKINGKRKFYINTHRGCVHKCSFCSIQKSIGMVQSMDLEEMYLQIEKAVGKGYEEIVLLGEDFGSIGLDRGYTAVDALKKICSISGDFKIYIHYFEPTMYLRYFEEIKKYLHKISIIQIGIQSFNNRILGEMKRKYTYEQVLDVISQTKIINPDIFIQNQLMYAYPGESRADFLSIMNQAIKSPYSLHVCHPYSPRLGMKKYPESEHITESERKLRSYIINKLIQKHPGKITCSWIPDGKSMHFDEYFNRY